VNVNAAATLTNVGATLVLTSGTINFNSGETVAPGILNMTGGTLAGSDTVTISGLFTFNGGTVGGSGTFNANGGIDMTSGTRYIDTRTVRNAGTATFSAVGYLYLQNGGGFNNLAAGTFDAESDYGIYPSGTPGNFTNAGSFTRTTSSGLFTVNVPFINTGTVAVNSGSLVFSGNATQTHTGPFSASGGILRFNGGTHTMNGGANITGNNVVFDGGTVNINTTYNLTGGTTTISGATVNFNPASTLTSIGADLVVSAGTVNFNSGEGVAPTTVHMTGGTLAGSDALTITGLFTFNGGTLGGSGIANANGGIDMTSNTRTVDTRTLRNAADAVFSAAGYLYLSNGGVFNNLATATFDAQSDYGIYFTGATPGTLVNAGSFTRTTSSGTFTVNADFTNTGIVESQSGILALNDYTQTAGQTIMSGGNLSTSTTLNINGGILKGTGTITGSVANAATVAPGLSPGTMTITQNYTQTAAGTLQFEQNGPTPGTQYDQLVVTGTVALAGTIDIHTLATPAVTTSFVLISNGGADAVSGNFTGAPEGTVLVTPDGNYRASYKGNDGNDVVLTFLTKTQYNTVQPCRIGDTRNTLAPALNAGQTRTFSIAGHCGIPVDAQAASFNFTVVGATANGNVRIYPGGAALPTVSTINYRTGQTRANNAIILLGPAGDITVQVGQANGTVHLIIDVSGYFQ
jgi:hypothetical protein